MLSGLDDLMNIVFPPGESKCCPVDFGQSELLNTLFRIWRKALRDKLTNPEFAFITRAELGLYSLLHHLGAKVSTGEVWRQVIQLAENIKSKEKGKQQ